MLIALLILSVIINIGFLIWGDLGGPKKEAELITTEVETGEQAVDLENTLLELEKYRGMSSQLDNLLDEANQKISAQEAVIANLEKESKDAKSQNKQLQAEREKLRQLTDEYLEKIDNLIVENEGLRSRSMELNKSVSSLQREVTTLRAKVNLGEQLLADNIEVTPVKKNIWGKYTETAMAKKTRKVEVCFDVLENKIAKQGEVGVFMRIFAPDAQTVFDEAAGSGYLADAAEGRPVQYTADQKINYKNAKQHVCLEWDAPVKYEPGTYLVELYTPGSKMGMASFTLR